MGTLASWPSASLHIWLLLCQQWKLLQILWLRVLPVSQSVASQICVRKFRDKFDKTLQLICKPYLAALFAGFVLHCTWVLIFPST